jgi:hypothetical protein
MHCLLARTGFPLVNRTKKPLPRPLALQRHPSTMAGEPDPPPIPRYPPTRGRYTTAALLIRVSYHAPFLPKLRGLNILQLHRNLELNIVSRWSASFLPAVRFATADRGTGRDHSRLPSCDGQCEMVPPARTSSTPTKNRAFECLCSAVLVSYQRQRACIARHVCQRIAVTFRTPLLSTSPS